MQVCLTAVLIILSYGIKGLILYFPKNSCHILSDVPFLCLIFHGRVVIIYLVKLMNLSEMQVCLFDGFLKWQICCFLGLPRGLNSISFRKSTVLVWVLCSSEVRIVFYGFLKMDLVCTVQGISHLWMHPSLVEGYFHFRFLQVFCWWNFTRVPEIYERETWQIWNLSYAPKIFQSVIWREDWMKKAIVHNVYNFVPLFWPIKIIIFNSIWLSVKTVHVLKAVGWGDNTFFMLWAGETIEDVDYALAASFGFVIDSSECKLTVVFLWRWRGLMCIHRMKIVHRDLKSANCLVNKHWVVKICDFGLSRIMTESPVNDSSSAGTPEWMAPELIRNEPFTEKCDIFSLGVIMWELCTLSRPWEGVPPERVFVSLVCLVQVKLDF